MPIAGINCWCHGFLSPIVYACGGWMAFQLQFFGAAERVTGSLYVLTAGQSRMVLGCDFTQPLFANDSGGNMAALAILGDALCGKACGFEISCFRNGVGCLAHVNQV